MIKKYQEKWLALFFLCLFTIASVIISTQKSIWRDEAFSIILSRLSIPVIIQGTSQDFSPPLFYLLLHVWLKLTSQQVIILRLLPMGFSIATCLVLFFIRKKFFSLLKISENINYILMWYIIITLNPVIIYFSAELRTYSLLMYLVLISSLASFNFVRKRQVRWLVIQAFTNTLILYTHNLGVFWVLSQSLVLLIYLIDKKNWALWRQLVLSMLAITTLFMPWLIVIRNQLSNFQSGFWVQFHWLYSLSEYKGLFWINEGKLHLPDNFYCWYIYISCLIFICGLVIIFRKYLILKLSAFYLLLTLVSIYLFSILVAPILYYRYITFLAPQVIIIIFIAMVTKINRGFYSKFILFAISIINLLLVTDLILGNSRTDYRKIISIGPNKIYSNEVLDIMPCIYYNPQCRFVGGAKDTLHFVGLSQLPNIITVDNWQMVLNDKSFWIIYRTPINQDLGLFIKKYNFVEIELKDLGDGVRLGHFLNLSKN